MELRRAKHSLSVISDQKDTSSLCCRTDSTALLSTGEPEHQNNFYTVRTSLGGGDHCLLRPVPAAHTHLSCSRLELRQTKALWPPVENAHLFDFAEEKYSQSQCQLCACRLPAETCDCVWPDAAAEGLSMGSQSWCPRHKVQGQGPVSAVCVVKTCIPFGRGRGGAQTASWALWAVSARGNKLTLAMSGLDHPAALNTQPQVAALPSHSTVTELGTWKQTLKQSALRTYVTVTTTLSDFTEINGTLPTGLTHLSLTSIPYLLSLLASTKLQLVWLWMSLSAWLGQKKWG